MPLNDYCEITNGSQKKRHDRHMDRPTDRHTYILEKLFPLQGEQSQFLKKFYVRTLG